MQRLNQFSKIFHLTISGLLILLAFPFVVQASGEFSGSNCANYQCPVLREFGTDNQYHDLLPEPGDCGVGGFVHTGNDGKFYCNYVSEFTGARPPTLALPVPPQLRVIEYWVVRVVYAAWALAGIFFTLVLMWIGFNYITSFGNEVALADVVKKFRYWLIGLVLVFLSYPILNTFFAILPIDTSQDCYQELDQGLIGFRFFFPQACGTDLSNSFTATVASCTATCNGFNAPPFNLNLQCGGLCTNIVVSCMNNCPKQASGTPEDACLAACLGGG